MRRTRPSRPDHHLPPVATRRHATGTSRGPGTLRLRPRAAHDLGPGGRGAEFFGGRARSLDGGGGRCVRRAVGLDGRGRRTADPEAPPRAAGIGGQLPRVRGRTPGAAPPGATVSDHAVRPSRLRSSTASRSARRARRASPCSRWRCRSRPAIGVRFTGARASRCRAEAKPGSQPAARSTRLDRGGAADARRHLQAGDARPGTRPWPGVTHTQVAAVESVPPSRRGPTVPRPSAPAR